jgi:hypothetical protein
VVLVDGWEGFEGEESGILRTAGVGRGEDEAGEGGLGEEGRDEVEALRDGGEFGVEDGLADPDEEGEVDEDVDGGRVHEDEADEDVEQVLPVGVLVESLLLLFLLLALNCPD